MFYNPDDDEQDFMSTGGSKLASLFGMDKASGQSGNASLTYTAPKQPKRKDTVTEGNAAPAVVVASIVHAYKYVDSKYVSQGKLGAALLLTQATKDYRILLYVNKQQQVTSGKINPTFAFSIQQNNYATFYDDARQLWSIMFETSEAAEKFAKEIALSKANSGALADVIQQDLLLGDGGSLETGDSAEVKYTGWLLTGGTFGKVFDQSAGDNYFRFRVGKGKVIKGWDQGMLGMKKGGKRLLIIPPSLAYGSQGISDRIPPNSSLIFEVHVMRVKLQKGESPQDSLDPAPLPSLASTTDQDDMDAPGVKDRSRSINEHLSQSPDSGKAKLISRMARMGQPMLPFQGAVPAQPDDSDEELHHQMQQTAQAAIKPALPTKPRSSSGAGLTAPVGQVIISQAQPMGMNPGYGMVNSQPVIVTSTVDMLQQQQQQQPAFLQNLPGAQQLAVYQNPHAFLQQQQQQQAALIQQQQQQLIQQQQQLLGQGLSTGVPGQTSAYGVPITPTPPTPHNPSSSADALAPVLLTENRQQNTEIRIGLSKVSDKVDKILEKVDHMSAAGLGAHAMGMISPYGGNFSAPSMEANVLMQNISRMVQENERLKKEVYEQSNKVQEQNDKIASLLEKNQKYVEQSQNLLELRNEGYKTTASQSQARVLALEQEKVHLATELSSSSAQIATLQLELGEYRKREGELKQQLQTTSTMSSSSREELDRLRLQREEDEQNINSLSTSIRDEKLARKALETKLASHQEELAEVKALKEAVEKSLGDRKRKAAEERRKLEEDLEDSKINYETTIEDLREKLRRQKTSGDVDTQSKMAKIEEEISREWQVKADRMLTAAAEKYSRQISDLKDEKEDLLRQIGDLEKKVVAVRSSGSSTEQQVSQLQDELAEMKLWKDKYDNLRTQAATMKDRYEKRIGELEGEKEEEEERKNEVEQKAKEQHQESQQKIQQLQQEVQHLRSQLSTARADVQKAAPAAPSTDVAGEVKKIMNSVFQSLRREFDVDESYLGAEVMATILAVIKQTTLQLVSQPSTRQESLEEEEEDEDQEDEDIKIVAQEEEYSLSESDLEDNVDEAREREATIHKEEIHPTSLASTTDQTLSVTLSKSEELPTEDQVEEEKQAEPVNLNQSPPTLSSSGSDVVTVYENLPSLDSHTKDEEVTTVVVEAVEQDVAANGEDDDLEDFLADDVEVHDENKSRTVADPSFEGLENEIETEKVQPNSKEPHVPQISSDKEKAAQPSVLSHSTTEADEKVQNGDESSTRISESSTGRQTSEQTKEVNTNTATNLASDQREPPPLFDEDDEEDDSPLFGVDSTVSETLGSAFKPKSAPGNSGAEVKSVAKSASSGGLKDKTTPGKKQDLVNDEDLKPQPPPPLFGDDSDEDDLDWLS